MATNKFRFTFVGVADGMEGDRRVVEAHGATRNSAEGLARARLREATRRDSSLYRTERVELLPGDEGR